jgi:hypothetical protein
MGSVLLVLHPLFLCYVPLGLYILVLHYLIHKINVYNAAMRFLTYYDLPLLCVLISLVNTHQSYPTLHCLPFLLYLRYTSCAPEFLQLVWVRLPQYRFLFLYQLLIVTD